MRPIVTNRVAWSVCPSACHTNDPCKNGWTNRDADWVEDSRGPKEPCIGWGSISPMGIGNFEGEGHAPTCPTTLCRELCKNGWTDQFTVWVVSSCAPKEAQVQSYSPGFANLPASEGTFAPPGEYDWTVRLRWRCGLMWNYFDHLFTLLHLYLLNHCSITASVSVA